MLGEDCCWNIYRVDLVQGDSLLRVRLAAKGDVPLGEADDAADTVRHGPGTADTYVGWILFEADRIMKVYGLGTDNVTRQRVVSRIADYHVRAEPSCGIAAGEEQTFVVVPNTEPGEAFAAEVRKVVPAALTVAAQGSATDLMFCRELGCLRPEDLMALVSACQPAYYQSLASPQTAPHARFDVMEWLPLTE